MARKARIPSSSGYYHVMMRGNNRENIFKDEIQKLEFLKLLKQQCCEKNIEITAWCLMNNHVHLVLKADIILMSAALQRINTTFAMHYNFWNNRIGHVFQGRFNSKNIETDKYLLGVIRYVHNNPCKANLVELPSEYKWSSYHEFLSQPKLINESQKRFVMSYFSGSNERYIVFHKEMDDTNYLEIKEDVDQYNTRKGQSMIAEFWREKGIQDMSTVFDEGLIDELIVFMLQKSKLSHRKIASLVGVNNSKVHYISLLCQAKGTVPSA